MEITPSQCARAPFLLLKNSSKRQAFHKKSEIFVQTPRFGTVEKRLVPKSSVGCR